MLICAPSTADCIRFTAPSAVSSIVAAIPAAAPAEFSKAPERSSTTPMLSNRTSKALWAFRPTSSWAPPRVRLSLLSFSRAAETSPPVAPTVERILRSAVPAWLPLMPLFAIAASIAVVCSMLSPAFLATGATNFMESWKLPMSRAELEKLAAITSVTLPVSLAFRPKALRVAPATSADCARSDPVACARFNVAPVTLVISVAENPSFENSSCKADTWEALNLVELPSSRAFSFSFLNSPAVAPETAFTFAIDCSKSAATLNEATAISPSGAVTFLVRLAPLLFRLLDVLRMERWAFCRPFSKPSALRSRRTLRRDCLAISSGIQFDQWWVLMCALLLLHMG